MKKADPLPAPTNRVVRPDLTKDGTMLMCRVHGIPFPKGSHCPKCSPLHEDK